MISNSLLLICLCVGVTGQYRYFPGNVTKRSQLYGIQAYRSALTLDWLAAEDLRQRELVNAFETEATIPRVFTSDCIAYPRPAPGKVARLMLELLKNLEGDDGFLISDLIQSLIKAKLLVETSMLDSEPDLETLMKTPDMMLGEPHTTFPKILATVWMTVTDPATTKKHGWCSIHKINKYLETTKPHTIAKHMRTLDSVVARARFIMEEFIHHVTPISLYNQRVTRPLGRERNQRKEAQIARQIKEDTLPPTTHRPLNKRNDIHANGNLQRPEIMPKPLDILMPINDTALILSSHAKPIAANSYKLASEWVFIVMCLSSMLQ